MVTRRCRHGAWAWPAVGLLLGLVSLAHAQPDLAARADRFLYLPPAWAERVVYYHSFDAALGQADINDLGASLAAAPVQATTGFAGLGCAEGLGPDRKLGYQISSDGLSPHLPLTLMCWFRLDAEPSETAWYNLLRLWGGNNYVTHFVAGKGEWCGLQEPTFIYQVVNFPGIPLYHNSWGGRPAFAPGEWHHVAMTVANAANVRFYRDGALVENILVKGQSFREGEVNAATFGDGGLPMTVDEVLVLDRALRAEEIAEYVAAARQLHDIGWAAAGPGR
jgi:hypothetical protein